MDILPFADLSGLELQNLLETGSDKLKNIINNSKLPKHINQLIPYFANSVPGSNYYIEDGFNSYINKIRPSFFVFHLNIRDGPSFSIRGGVPFWDLLTIFLKNNAFQTIFSIL